MPAARMLGVLTAQKMIGSGLRWDWQPRGTSGERWAPLGQCGRRKSLKCQRRFNIWAQELWAQVSERFNKTLPMVVNNTLFPDVLRSKCRRRKFVVTYRHFQRLTGQHLS